MTQLTDKHWAVEVPDDAKGIVIRNYGLNDALEYTHHIDHIAAYCVDDLPPVTCQFLFTTKEATEEDGRRVVEDGESGYKGYDVLNDNILFWRYALESLASLLHSKNLDPNKNFAIIQQQ